MKPHSPLPGTLPQSFSVRSALEAGATYRRLRGRDLTRPFHGVRSTSRDLILEQRCRALATRLPEFAFFSGITAACLRGVPLPLELENERRVHVTVPESRRARYGAGVVGHAARVKATDSTAWHGLRISSAERVWCELAACLDLADLVAAGDFLIHREMPHTTVDQLTDSVMRYPGRRGRRLLRTALPLLDDGAESPRESIIRVLLVLAGVTGFVTNLKIRASTGHNYRGDLVFVAEKVIVEYQGKQHLDDWLKDMTRKSRLQADGWLVIEVNVSDLDDPAELVNRVRKTLALRAKA